MNAQITKIKRQTVVTTVYEVQGIPPEKIQFGKVMFRPARLTVIETDGSVSRVLSEGPRAKKDGTDGEQWHDFRYYGRSDWPDWVRAFIEGMGK